MKSNTLPIIIKGQKILSLLRILKRGSAQCKSAVCLLLLIQKENCYKSKKSRDHTNCFQISKIPIKVIRKINYDLIEINGKKVLNQ